MTDRNPSVRVSEVMGQAPVCAVLLSCADLPEGKTDVDVHSHFEERRVRTHQKGAGREWFSFASEAEALHKFTSVMSGMSVNVFSGEDLLQISDDCHEQERLARKQARLARKQERLARKNAKQEAKHREHETKLRLFCDECGTTSDLAHAITLVELKNTFVSSFDRIDEAPALQFIQESMIRLGYHKSEGHLHGKHLRMWVTSRTLQYIRRPA
jgi:hypothetical protein